MSRPPRAGAAVLGAAGAFALEEAAVWEYIALVLQHHTGVAPAIAIQVRATSLTITIDGGPGLDAQDLIHAFSPPSEHPARWDGQPSRRAPSRWATAAFGIAERLEVEAVQGGLCRRVQLTRAALAHSASAHLPLEWLGQDQPTARPPGITITLDEIGPERPDAGRIAAHIERRLPSLRGARPRVSVDGRQCSGEPPTIAFSRTCRPSPEQAAVLGDAALHLAVAREPLPAAWQGILVLGREGSLIGIMRGDGMACSRYLCGEIAVPALDHAAIGARGPDRTLRLDSSHPVSAPLAAFVGAKIRELGSLLEAQNQTAGWYRRLLQT